MMEKVIQFDAANRELVCSALQFLDRPKLASSLKALLSGRSMTGLGVHDVVADDYQTAKVGSGGHKAVGHSSWDDVRRLLYELGGYRPGRLTIDGLDISWPKAFAAPNHVPLEPREHKERSPESQQVRIVHDNPKSLICHALSL